MVTPAAMSAAVLQLAALAAAYATWVCLRLQTYGSDRRLTALAWFFGLFAVSVALHTAAAERRRGAGLVLRRVWGRRAPAFALRETGSSERSERRSPFRATA